MIPATGRGSKNSDVNVIMWSWCGQASGLSEQQMISNYLAPMSDLETKYWGVKFVYMTCHLDGSGSEGNMNLRNEQIRAYCSANKKILFDFADIESYDPDGQTNYMLLKSRRRLQLPVERPDPQLGQGMAEVPHSGR